MNAERVSINRLAIRGASSAVAARSVAVMWSDARISPQSGGLTI